MADDMATEIGQGVMMIVAGVLTMVVYVVVVGGFFSVLGWVADTLISFLRWLF
jgi:hypothetical protein